MDLFDMATKAAVRTTCLVNVKRITLLLRSLAQTTVIWRRSAKQRAAWPACPVGGGLGGWRAKESFFLFLVCDDSG